MSDSPLHQTEHPLFPKIPDDIVRAAWEAREARPETWAVVESMAASREETIRLMSEDALHHGHRSPRWLDIMRGICEMRLANLGAPLEVLISGGVRGSKSFLGAFSHNAHFFGTHKAMTWCFHSTDDSSAEIAEPIIYAYLPRQFKVEKVRKRTGAKGQKMGYVEGHGFIGDKFTLHVMNNGVDCGGTCSFWTYRNKVGDLQGSALTFVWLDELAPKAFMETIRERLLTRAAETRLWRAIYEQALETMSRGEWPPLDVIAKILHGLALYTFTPKDGWTDTVNEFLTDSTVVRTTPAELLPKWADGAQAYEEVPLERACKKTSRRVFYLHTKHNVIGGNYEGIKAELAGADRARVLCSAYGVVEKSTQSCFPKFNTSVHVVPLSRVPKDLTIYHYLDPAGRKPWFAGWIGVDAIGRHWVLREWPQDGSEIAGIGDPGPWAVPSKSGRPNGDVGECQKGFGFSRTRYKDEFMKVERELGRWQQGGEVPGEGTVAARMFERYIDRHYGNAEFASESDGSETLSEQLGRIGLDYRDEECPNIDEGIGFINDELAYDDGKPVDDTNFPTLYVVETCKNFIFALSNFTDCDHEGRRLGDLNKAACKEPIDILRWHLTMGCRYVSAKAMKPMGGMNR